MMEAETETKMKTTTRNMETNLTSKLPIFRAGSLVQVMFGEHSPWCKKIGSPTSVTGKVVESGETYLRLDNPRNPGARYGMTEYCWGEVRLNAKRGVFYATIQHAPTYQADIVTINPIQ